MSKTPRLLPASAHVLYTTVAKIASTSRHSHTSSWNAWVGRTTIMLRWTASACEWSILCPLTTRSCITVSTTKQQTMTLPGIICRTRDARWCYVIWLDMTVCLFGTIVCHTRSYTQKHGGKRRPLKLGLWYQMQGTPEMIRNTQYRSTRYHRTTAQTQAARWIIQDTRYKIFTRYQY